MPSEEFYTWTGIVALLLLIFGGLFSFGPNQDYYAPAPLRMVGPVIFFIGIIFVLVFFGGLFIDLRARFKIWNMERKSDEIDKRMDELDLKEKENELKRKEREYREEQERKEQEYRNRTHVNLSDVFSPQPFRSPNSSEPKTKSEPAHPPVQDLQKSVEQKSEEQPILKTGDRIPDNLLRKEEDAESEEVTENVEKESLEEKYMRFVKEDSILRYLLLLKETSEGYVIGQSEVIRREEGKPKGDVSGRKRQEMHSRMKELEHAGLVEISTVKEDITGKKTSKYAITELGRKYFEKLWDEKIKTWTDFMEKYGREIYGKK